MTTIADGRLRPRLRAARQDERGIAIVTVLTLITAALAVAGVAAVTVTNAMHGSVRDEDSKQALGAADAGAQVALMRQNQVGVDDALPCVGVDPETLVLEPQSLLSGDWCQAPPQGSVGDATYAYRVRRPAATEFSSTVEIVSAGTAGDVTRRIHVIAESPLADSVFDERAVIADTSIELRSNSQVHGDAATNGPLTVLSGSNAQLCGDAVYGEGDPPATGGPDCEQSDYQESLGAVPLPPVQPPTDIATNNSNWRIDPSDPQAPDTISGDPSDVRWEPNAGTNGAGSLVLNSNSTITLGGDDYWLCHLQLKSNTSLIVAAGATVRLFFDSPDNCPPPPDGHNQILLDSNSALTTTSGNPGSLQILAIGKAEAPGVDAHDGIALNSNSTTTMPVIVYAPHSFIEMKSNATFIGAVGGEGVVLDSNARLFWHEDASGLELPVPLHYRQTQFVECASTAEPMTTDTPAADC